MSRRRKGAKMPVVLSADEEAKILAATVKLGDEYRGRIDRVRVEAIVADSKASLVALSDATGPVPAQIEQLAQSRLRALVRLQDATPSQIPSVLFLCVHNAGRSQMAAGFMRALATGRIDVYSGGSEPTSQLNTAAIGVMAEVGIDISQELPQPWADETVRVADVVVTMGCGDECPYFPGTRYVDWDIEDPAGQSPEHVRPIRDDIKSRVEGLMVELGVEPVSSEATPE